MDHQDIIDQPTDAEEKKVRPTIITVICVLCFIGAAVAIPMVFSDAAALVGTWYPPYLGFSTAAGLTCMIGLWKMKKWGAYGYTALVVLNQIVMIRMDVWSILALVIPAFVVIVAMAHLKRMD